VDEDDNVITTLEKGEVFGEMSMISGKPAGATVRAVSPTTVMRLPGKELNALLPQYPSLQSYFTRLLTRRLADSNVERSQDLSSGMTGKLSDMPPEELLQTLKFNAKTGALTLKLKSGPAEVYFREGEIIHAEYDALEGVPAIAAIVKNRTGKFQFNPVLPSKAEGMKILGNFMGILMDALKDMDEFGEPDT